MRSDLRTDILGDLKVDVCEREQIARDVVLLTLRSSSGEALPPWQPGAHIDLHLPSGLLRQYSLCSEPRDLSHYQVAVLLEADGRGGSQEVHERVLKGETLELRGPRNHFELVEAERYLFIAGGIGITPILPMVHEVDRRGADWSLCYGGRSRSSMAFRESLTSRYGERVTVRPQDEVGLLDVTSLLGAAEEGTAVYCCGPEGLIFAVEKESARHATTALHVERFSPKELPPLADERAFEVEFAASGISVTVPPGVPIIDAAEDAGVFIETSCTQGVCGTCRTLVLDGEPDHRDSVLSPEERAANNVMQPCVSRSRSARLVLDA